MQNLFLSYAIPTAVFFIFALLHSVTASHNFKKRILGLSHRLKAWYRILYNTLSTVLIILWWITLPQDKILYQFEGIIFFLFIAVQFAFAYLFLKSIFAQNGMIFLGFKQIIQFFREGTVPRYLDEPRRGKLVTGGLYQYMRHPMYTFAVLTLIFTPIMTQNLLYSIIIFSLYFWIGSYFEEKNLIARFGEDYKEYQKSVPRFIPIPFKQKTPG